MTCAYQYQVSFHKIAVLLPCLSSFGKVENWFFDEVRVRYALRELVQMSLITHHESNDSHTQVGAVMTMDLLVATREI